MIDSAPFARQSAVGRPMQPLTLTSEERSELEAILRTGTAELRVARRAQALLLLADDVPQARVAQLVGVDERTVRKWRTRFDHPDPLARLADAPRPGRPRSFVHAA
jgi:hypothetical protein